VINDNFEAFSKKIKLEAFCFQFSSKWVEFFKHFRSASQTMDQVFRRLKT
jgi:hypothetical protein